MAPMKFVVKLGDEVVGYSDAEAAIHSYPSRYQHIEQPTASSKLTAEKKGHPVAWFVEFFSFSAGPAGTAGTICI
jgi:hypothetical protein